MNGRYEINIINHSEFNEDFFVFQAPALYRNISGGKIYSNSLYQERLAPFHLGGGVMQFHAIRKIYAGARAQSMFPCAGRNSGGTTAFQLMYPTENTGSSVGNASRFAIDPISLDMPTGMGELSPGGLRIYTPIYNPAFDGNFNIGLAVKNSLVGAPVILSSFIIARPNQFVDFFPVLIFYVAVGSYVAGQVIDFAKCSKFAAMCDATNGASVFFVAYLGNGKWRIGA